MTGEKGSGMAQDEGAVGSTGGADTGESEITTDVVVEAEGVLEEPIELEEAPGLTPEEVGAQDPAEADPADPAGSVERAAEPATEPAPVPWAPGAANQALREKSGGVHPSWGGRSSRPSTDFSEPEVDRELSKYKDQVPDTFAEDVAEHEAMDAVDAELDDEVAGSAPESAPTPAPSHAQAAATAAGPVMAPAPPRVTEQAAPGAQEKPPAAGWGAGQTWDQAQAVQMQDHESESLIKSTWRWAAATVILFPLFALWTLPSAALTSRAVDAGDLDGARREASLARLLGLISVVVFLVFVVLWLILVIVAAATGADAASTGVTVGTTPAVFEPGTRVSTA